MAFLPLSRTRFLRQTIVQSHRQAYKKAVKHILEPRSKWMVTFLAVNGRQKYHDHVANEAIVQFYCKARMSAKPHKERVLVDNKPNKKVCP